MNSDRIKWAHTEGSLKNMVCCKKGLCLSKKKFCMYVILVSFILNCHSQRDQLIFSLPHYGKMLFINVKTAFDFTWSNKRSGITFDSSAPINSFNLKRLNWR